MQNSSQVNLGTPIIYTTENRGMSPDEWVELALNRIISISDTAPMPLREQALAFRDQLRHLLLFYFKKVARSERTTIAGILRKEGFPHIADKIVDII
jgi:hypothetical protein